MFMLFQGVPNLDVIDQTSCEYVFEWQTNAACPDTGPVEEAGCRFTDPRTLATYDFSSLHKPEHYTVSGHINMWVRCTVLSMERV